MLEVNENFFNCVFVLLWIKLSERKFLDITNDALLRFWAIVISSQTKILLLVLAVVRNMDRIEMVDETENLFIFIDLFWVLLKEPPKHFHCFLCLTYLENVWHYDVCTFLYIWRLPKLVWDSLEHVVIIFLDVKVKNCLWITVNSMNWILRIESLILQMLPSWVIIFHHQLEQVFV